MNINKPLISVISVMLYLVLSGATTPSIAADFDFSGHFTQDNDVVLLNFTVGVDSDVTIFSSSWDDGGLDPVLAIWDDSGNLVAEQDDGGLIGSQLSNGVFYDFDVWDSFFDLFLTSGDYIASISMFDNFSNSTALADGFTYDSDPNFSAAFGCSNGEFCGVSGFDDNRTSFWEFHILNVDSASNPLSIPEPNILALFILGLGALVMPYGRRNQSMN